MNTLVAFYENVQSTDLPSVSIEKIQERTKEEQEEEGKNTSCMIFVGLQREECADELVSLTEATDDTSSASDYSSDETNDFEFILRSTDTARSSRSSARLWQDKRKVTFNTKVQIREFKLTIGDHPFCKDSLPLSLDWPYSETSKHINLSRHRGKSYSAGPLLSVESRKQRLIDVSKYERTYIDMFLHENNDDGNDMCYLLEKIMRSVRVISQCLPVSIPVVVSEDDK